MLISLAYLNSTYSNYKQCCLIVKLDYIDLKNENVIDANFTSS